MSDLRARVHAAATAPDGELTAQRGSEPGSLKTRSGSSTPTVAPTSSEPSTTTPTPSTTVAPPGTTVPIGPGPNQWATCQYANATAGSDGNFTTTFAAQLVLHWTFQGEVDESGECGVDGACVIEVWVTPNGFEDFDSTVYRVWVEPDHPAALTFTPAPTTTTTSMSP